MNTYKTMQDAPRSSYGAHSGDLCSDATALSLRAHARLLDSLRAFGNVPSEDHVKALRDVCNLYARILFGECPASGRYAVPLDTGMGKTESVIAIIRAIVELDLDKSVMVCQSTVESLCKTKRRLLAAGVPADSIGLVHSLPVDSACHDTPLKNPNSGHASEPSLPTDADYSAYQFLLVTHAKTRGTGLERCTEYGARLRDLNIWDETMLKTKADSITLEELRLAVGNLKDFAQSRPDYKDVMRYLSECLASVTAENNRQESGGEPGGFSLADALPPDLLEHHLSTLGRAFRGSLRFQNTLQGVLPWLSNGEPCRVIRTGVPCLAQYSKAIPDTLGMVVLDASYNIHTLEQMDRSISPLFPPDSPAGIKRYDKVLILQMYAHSGNGAIGGSLHAIAKEVSAVIKGIPDDEGVIIFTFKDHEEAFAQHLRDLGVSISQTIAPPECHGVQDQPRPRINVLHWGQEKGLNDYGYCSNVILAGILHKPKEALAGATLGQLDDNAAEIPQALLKDVEVSEWADRVFQAIGRSSCRRVVAGYAAPAKVWLIHPDSSIRDVLTNHMQGIRWETWNALDPEAAGVIKTHQLAEKIVEELAKVPITTPTVSSTEIRRSLGDPEGSTYRRARDHAMESNPEWGFIGRSYYRKSPT